MPQQYEYPQEDWMSRLGRDNGSRQQFAAMQKRPGEPEFGGAEIEKAAGMGSVARGGSKYEASRIEKVEMPGGGQDLKVWVNPTKSQMQGLAREAKDYRSIQAHGNWYYWDASKAIHNYVTRKLGISEADVRSGGGGSIKDLMKMYDE